jgi:alpha-tubulin suppressor-like RCC1 family protein
MIFIFTSHVLFEYHELFVFHSVRGTQVACGEMHVLAVSVRGRVYSWGLNNSAQV